MTPEGKVKAHLKKRIKALGGELRFVKWIGRRNAPDCYVMFLNGEHHTVGVYSHILRNCWVETKAEEADGRLSPGQVREIERMRACGETVLVLPTIEDIDREFPAP